MKLSEKIVYLRKNRQISQEHLSRKLGVSRQTIYKWEADLSKPELPKIQHLAEIFNVSYDLLLNDKIDLEEYFKNSSLNEDTVNDTVCDIESTEENNILTNEKNDNKRKNNLILIISIAIIAILAILASVIIGIIVNDSASNDTDTDTDTDTSDTIDPNEIIVTFDTTGGYLESTQKFIKCGEKLGTLPVPTKKNHKFLYWTENGVIVNEEMIVDSNITLYAKWESLENSILFTLDLGNEENEKEELYLDKGIRIDNVLPVLTSKNGLRFAGWFDKNGIMVTKYSRYYEDTTLKAYWGELTICPNTGKEHMFEEWNYTNAEPQCEKSGYAYKVCRNCFYEVQDLFKDALGHKYDDWTYGPMYQERKCQRCLKEERIDYTNLSNKIEKTIPSGDALNYYSYVNLYNGDWIEEVGLFCSGGGEFAIDFEFNKATNVDVVFIKCSTDEAYTFSVLYEGEAEYTKLTANIPFNGEKALCYNVNGKITKARIYLSSSKGYVNWQEVAFATIPNKEQLD